MITPNKEVVANLVKKYSSSHPYDLFTRTCALVKKGMPSNQEQHEAVVTEIEALVQALEKYHTKDLTPFLEQMLIPYNSAKEQEWFEVLPSVEKLNLYYCV